MLPRRYACAARADLRGDPARRARLEASRRSPSLLPSPGWLPLLLTAVLAVVLLSAGGPGLARAEGAAVQDSAGGPSAGEERDLTGVWLQDLMNLQVTSASKKAQRLSKTASAITVISPEDIRRSGATCLPELLRLVPGLDVARINASKWAISARGFNARFGTKMLVLVDGRSVYTPLFSGVQWDDQEMVLADILRIEVIRGPGATVWGANAVNGVINIITRPARDTQGSVVSVAGGAHVHGQALVRQGGTLGARGHYRVFAKGLDHAASTPVPGAARAEDSFRRGLAGFRADLGLADRSDLTLQGDLRRSDSGEQLSLPLADWPYIASAAERTRSTAGNLLARWHHVSASGSELTVQSYVDYSSRVNEMLSDNRLLTIDQDFQHQWRWGSRQEIVWGGGYRYSSDEFVAGPKMVFTPARQTYHLASAFLEDEITLAPDRLSLTVGSKLEHGDFAGVEVQPSARLLWNPDAGHALWAAASRAERSPARGDLGVSVGLYSLPNPPLPTTLVRVVGNEDFRPEILTAYEVGFRAQRGPRLSFDLAGFHHRYDDLRGAQPGTPYLDLSSGAPVVIMPMVLANAVRAQSWGSEASLSWTVIPAWRVVSGGSWFAMSVRRDPGTADGNEEGAAPRFQWNARSMLDVSRSVEWDVTLLRVGELRTLGIEAYTRLDTRLGWTRGPVELSLVGQNLTEARHREFNDVEDGTLSTEVQRSGYARLTWRF